MTIHSGPTNAVLVGVDGSDSAMNAVRWAAAEAGRRGVPLRVVHAEMPLPTDALDSTGMARKALHEEALRLVGEAVAVAREVVPALEVDVRIRVDYPGFLLREESDTAALAVLGNRGLGGFTGLLLGSTAITVGAHGHCPVVVVRGDDVSRSGPVVVGVDDAPGDAEVLDHAFTQASARGATLVVVHAWRPPFGEANIAAAVGLDWDALDQSRRSALSTRLQVWREKYPDVSVEQVVVHGSPARRLLERADGAALVVVGSRGRGGFAGLLLGSTSQALIHHAPCPVLVVRPVDST